ncbi:MAG: hypothetical protein IJO87_01340 [Eggerthellaceae bacterium]|nr:hypothetical protein [Eggerthellaceae bacterium]
MGYYKKHELFEMTIELTEEIVSESGDKSTAILSNPKNMANFIQVIFDKLCEINETLEDEDDDEEEEEVEEVEVEEVEEEESEDDEEESEESGESDDEKPEAEEAEGDGKAEEE